MRLRACATNARDGMPRAAPEARSPQHRHAFYLPIYLRLDRFSSASNQHRLVMCHLAVDTTFGSRFGVKVCDEEADKPRAMPSIVLMRTLAEKYPEADFIFALGGDQVSELPSWQAPAEPGYWDEIEDGPDSSWKHGF